MAIKSDAEHLSGQPRIEGTRLSVGMVISGVGESGLNGFLDDFDISDSAVKDAVDYCRGERCLAGALRFCDYCVNHPDHPLCADLSKKAMVLHQMYFMNDRHL